MLTATMEGLPWTPVYATIHSMKQTPERYTIDELASIFATNTSLADLFQMLVLLNRRELRDKLSHSQDDSKKLLKLRDVILQVIEDE
jgi:hypothetical protein